MRSFLLIVFAFFFSIVSNAQDVQSRLAVAMRKLEEDPQFKHASLSLFVVNSKSGMRVFEKNSKVGLAPASCQKVITSVAAFDLLGKDYRFRTQLAHDGSIENHVLRGNLHILGSGDPTFGSARWSSTGENVILKNWVDEIRKKGIAEITGSLVTEGKNWDASTIPDGWIWQDIGNYYGAGASLLNWRENQYDLVLQSGSKPGDSVKITGTVPALWNVNFVSELVAAEKGSGDNAFIYLPVNSSTAHVRGTIPAGEKRFVISGAFPNSAVQFVETLRRSLQDAGVSVPLPADNLKRATPTIIATQLSPPLDSINYWFLKKSINLYGEALIKAIGFEKGGMGSTGKGIEILRFFWSQRGIEKSEINILDGSGLSPQNRVTTEALVKVMQHAKTRLWYPSFLQALPEINGIKMKSGSISGARSYTGYITSRAGDEFTFAIIVNNYDGSAGEVVRKIWRVLDVMK
jgi:D-alanyl-D-alanine carboxypeptidase/D-alanyl-D-alanine-endopeptidase (penicillin-binding protein 4)